MRFKMFAVVLLFLLTFTTLINFPDPADAATYDSYEVPPGAPRWFSLQDFDEKGDKLSLTIVFKKNPDGTFQERPVDILIIESSRAKRNPTIGIARSEAIFIRENVSRRLEENIVNPVNAPMSIMFYNKQQEGDLENWGNATLKIRVDYEVENVKRSEDNTLLTIILVLLIIVIIAAIVMIAYYILRRRTRDARNFFNPKEGLYYVFRDIDGTIYYFNEGEYTALYNSNSLVTYEYLGQALKKGGPIMTPVEEAEMFDQGAAPIEGQPMMAVPVQSSVPLNMDGSSTTMMGAYPSGTDLSAGPEQETYSMDVPVQEVEPSGVLQGEPALYVKGGPADESPKEGQEEEIGSAAVEGIQEPQPDTEAPLSPEVPEPEKEPSGETIGETTST